MKRMILTVLAAAAAVTLPSGRARAEGDRAYFAIEAETSATKTAGMPKMQMPAGFQLPPGVQLPPEVAAMMSGGASRKLNIRLWSPSIAPDGATASVAPPAGLNQGPRLDLELYRPKPTEGTTPGARGQMPGGMADFTMKLYWGSSKTVRPGQPKVIHLGDLTGDQKAQADQAMAHARAGASYFYKAGWTTGYWPTTAQPGKIDLKASLLGTFALTTNYTGNVSLDVPPDVDFLDGIDLSSPDLSRKPDLNSYLGLVWKQIPNLLGMHAMVTGMEGRNTFIIWSSSEVEAFPFFDTFLEMAQVRQFVAEQKFMAGDRTDCDVPAGIFAGADMANLRMVGWGKGTARDATQPLPRLQTKTTLNVMLGGKMMAGRGGMGGMGQP
jgi:hypothetical protein